MDSTISMIESAAVIVLGVLFLAGLGNRLESRPYLKAVAIGIVFGLIGILGMVSPVEVAPGFRVDARNVVVVLSAAVTGPLGALITSIMLCVTRGYFGGAGAVGGIVSISLVAAAGSSLWLWMRARNRWLDLRHLAGYAAITALIPIVTVPFFAAGKDMTLALTILTYLVPTNVIGTFLLGILMIWERQRRWAIAAFENEQAKLQAIANNAPGVLFQLSQGQDGEIRFIYVSAGAERILGVKPETLIADPQAIGRFISRQALDEIAEALQTSATSRHSWRLEIQFERPDGVTLWISAAAEPRQGPSGRLVWDGSLFDITQQKRSTEMKDEFISTVSHELRTPLTSIRGSLGLIASGAAGALSDKAAKLVGIAHKNSERLVLLVNDILDIEKIESGRMPFVLATQEVAPVVEGAIEASRDYLADRGVEILFDDGAQGAAAYIDPDRLHQVLTNLLSNAIKFSPAGGVVTVATGRVEDMVRISVTDTGPGIAEEFQSRIFGRFEQADASATRATGGTGLGLSIVKAIIERLDGRVSFETQTGRGTTFLVDLTEIADPTRVVKNGGGYEAEPASRRVLVVEDEEDVATLISLNLAADGVICDVANNIAMAKSLLASNDYIAMTLDIRLADESGIVLLRDIREKGNDLPVVVVSATAEKSRKELNGSVLGIADWIEKAHDLGRLRTAISRVSKRSGPPRVLHIEDNKDIRDIIAAGLDDIAITPAATIAEATERLTEGTYDTVILDLDLPDGSGETLIDFIPEHTPVVIFSAFEVERRLAQRVRAAFSKSTVSEIELGRLVRRLTSGEASAVRRPHSI